MKAVNKHKVTQGLPHQFNCGYYLQWKAGSSLRRARMVVICLVGWHNGKGD